MSKYLATLLSKETSGFKKFIDDIEHATGYNKHDLKLSSSISQIASYKILLIVFLSQVTIEVITA